MWIREALDEDWPRIYPTFRAVVEEGKTYAYPEDLTLEEARSWWMEKSPAVTVIAIKGDAVVGSAKMGPNRPVRGSHIATASFMVDPVQQGTGVGTVLGEYAIEWARTSGYGGMQFNAVVETNGAAVHLWQKLGFEILTTVPESFAHPEHGFVGLHVMFQSF
ncbi:MAG: GNAT family N-acetyltransferase [Actinomycetota bacterium]|nr:GNAT family N-acetyltransferase [Actinomycetota bacterium]